MVLSPSDLLLTPNMRFTLDVQGGPSKDSLGKKREDSVSFVLEMKDREIATINPLNEITAHKLGDTELIGKIIHTRDSESHLTTVISSRKVTVRVRLVTHVSIPHNRQRQIYSGSILK